MKLQFVHETRHFRFANLRCRTTVPILSPTGPGRVVGTQMNISTTHLLASIVCRWGKGTTVCVQ